MKAKNPIKMRSDIRDLVFPELEEQLRLMKDKAFRAKQIYRWLYKKKVSSFEDMRNVPAGLQQSLKNAFSLSFPAIQDTRISQDGTIKLLLELSDGQMMETVYIPTRTRLTVCVSSQVGCKYACRFCASGLGGFMRNLSCAEIINQVLLASVLFDGREATHVVFMGVGEPFDNYINVMKAIRIMNHKEGLNIGARKITLSTCGVIPGIQKFSQEGLQVELSVSLHGYDDASRDLLMPVNKRYPFSDLFRELKMYYRKTKRQVTFEYVLIPGLTCLDKAAPLLRKAFRGLDCKMNLIPYNVVTDFDFPIPSMAQIRSFQKRLSQNGIRATVRSSRGDDVQASCGQLRYQRL